MQITERRPTGRASLLQRVALSALLAQGAYAHPLITNVIETGGDNEATDTVPAKWTGVTFVNGVANEPKPNRGATDPYTVVNFGLLEPAFVDRAHAYTNAGAGIPLPSYLAGGEYIMTGQDNRDNPSHTLNVSVSCDSHVYLLIDNRLTDANNANPPTFDATHMQWVVTEGWTPVITGLNRANNPTVPDEVGIDEATDGTINQWFSVYTKRFPAGSFTLKQADNAGQNMYGVVVKPASGVLASTAQVGGNKVGSVIDNGCGSYTVIGAGNDIWDQRDEFTYQFTEVIGDFDVQVRVESLSPAARWTKAGIMARESLSEFSRMAFVRTAPGDVPTGNGQNGVNDVKFMYRTGLDNNAGVNGGQHEDGTGVPTYPNTWLRLVRVGNTVFSSNSSDGLNWSFLASQDTTSWGGGALSNRLYLGLAVSRHGSSTSLTATAEFRDFRFNTNNAPFVVVAASSRGNPNGIRVNFNVPVGESALNPANYTVSTVSGPNVTVVRGLRFTTANDAAERDPMTFRLEGTLGDAAGPWTVIATGDTGLGTARFTTAPDVTFPNTSAYRTYRLIFPTIRNVSANSMQIAEVAFLDANGNDVTAPGNTVVPTSSNSPGGEQSPNAIDNNNNTKYLNFDRLNTGFTVTPSGGSTPAAPAIVSVVAGPTPTSVQLVTAGLVEGAVYEITVANVLSSTGEAINNSTVSFKHGEGFEARRIHITHNKTDDFGYFQQSDAVSRFIGDVIHAAGGVTPGVQTNSLFEDVIPDNDQRERFSTRIAGVLAPTVTGNYTFYMSSDDQGRLFLSNDANPANKSQIASEPSWAASRAYINARSCCGEDNSSRGNPPVNVSAPQSLRSGDRYYLELIFTEGGGGNNGSATWLPPGGTPVANGSTPISESAFAPSRMVDGQVFFTLGAVQVVAQPTNTTITALLPVTFRVNVDGTPSYRFQWRRNGQAIPGATGPSYTIPATQLSDDQASFSVVVANEFSSTVSSNAVLTVLTPTPPHLTGVRAEATFNSVVVSFDNRLEIASATNIANYSIPGLTIESATRDSSGRRVVLRTSAITPGASYTLTVSNIRDETGTTVLDPSPSVRNFTAPVFTSGFALMEVYPTGGGNTVNLLTGHPSYPNAPTERYFIRSANSREAFPNDSREAYGGRISGWFVPPTDGSYQFSINNDDDALLRGSLTENPAQAVDIGAQACCSGTYRATGTPLNLTGGNRYYFELLWKEGTGGDYAALSRDGATALTGSELGVFVSADDVSLVITQQPASVTHPVNSAATFTVRAALTNFDNISRVIAYQWRSNGVDIAGANGATYTTPLLASENDGDVYTVVLSVPGATVTSDAATVTVVEDTILPVLNTVRTDASFRKIYLTWSEVMNEGASGESSNYALRDSGGNDVDISGATITASGSNVVITLAQPLAASSTYELDIASQADLVGNMPLPVGNSQLDPGNGVVATFSTWAISRGFTRFDAYLNLPSGQNIGAFVAMPIYPNGASISFYTNVVFLPQTNPNLEQYALRFSGLFRAPLDGQYRFNPDHDDDFRLRISADSDPSNPTFSEMAGGCCTGLTDGGTLDVTLTAGQTYYYELIVREFGGGDHGGIAVTLPNGTVVSPVSSEYLAVAVDPATAVDNPGISQQPQGVTIVENQPATFNVTVTNAGPNIATYQWQVNTGSGFSDIPGATSASYTTPLRTSADDGDQYRVLVFLPGVTLTSAPATLTINPDAILPQVAAVRGTRGLNAIVVQFDEAVANASATEVSNYALTDSNGALINLGTPVLGGDLRTVTIPTDAQTIGATYTLSVENVQDIAGNTMATTNVEFRAFIYSRGFALAEYYNNITGTTLADLTNNAAYPNSPSVTEYVSLIESRTDSANFYGVRISGLLLPPVSGDYNFYVSADDQAGVFLSTDASPANRAQIASEPAWAGSRQYILAQDSQQATRGTPPSNIASNVMLTVGQARYFEALMKEGDGGDNLSVAWKLPRGAAPANGSLPIQGVHFMTLADPVGASITFTQQPAPMTTNVAASQTVTLQVGAVGTNVNGAAPIAYQWQRRDGTNWTDIVGANGATYTTRPVPAGSETEYRALVFIPGAEAASASVTVVGYLVLNWTDPGVLQQADDILGPWTDVPGAVNSLSVDPRNAPKKFYRLRPQNP
jgi:hypothetical protein